MSRHVLVVTPDFPPALGGIQRVVSEVAHRLSVDREVTVVAPAVENAGPSDEALPFRVIRTHASWGGAGTAAVLAEMALLANRSGADALVAAHVMTLPAAATLRRRPVVTMLYGSELWDPRAQRVLNTFRGRSRRFVAISDFTRREAVWLGVPIDAIDIVALGADAPTKPRDALERLAALGLVDEEGVRPFLLTISRLAEPHKGQDAVLRAVPALAAHEPRFRYLIAGDGPLRGHLEAVASTSQASRAAVFAGRVDEETKGALLRGCRALAMVSREARAAAQFEGFGLVYVEAALAARPSLAGRAGAAPEVVAHGETGLLVEPDRPAQIADAALMLLDGDLADRLGAEAYRRADEASTWAIAGRRLRDAIVSVLE